MMITEGQKYFSGIFRNIGFALLAPFGSIVFQAVVFKRDLFNSGYFWVAAIIVIISWLFFYLGYIFIREKR